MVYFCTNLHFSQDFLFLNFADQQKQQQKQQQQQTLQQQPNQQQQDFSQQQHQSTLTTTSTNFEQKQLSSQVNQAPLQQQQQQLQQQIIEQEEIKQQPILPSFQNEIKVVVLIPVGIPGFGKTFYSEYLKNEIEQKKLGSFLIISSDKIRKEQMDLLQQKTPQLLTQQTLFDETAKIATQLFRKSLKQLIENLPLTHGQSTDQITFIMLDKTHPPNSLDSTQKLLREYCSLHAEIQLKIVALFPGSICPFFRYKNEQQQLLNYPFSLNYFFSCLKRVQERKVHETLIGDHENSALIVLYFIQLFRNANVSKEAIEKYGFDLKLRLPFLYEDAKSNDQFNEALIEKFKAVLNSIVPFKECNMELLKDFIYYFENYQFPLKEILPKDLIKGAEYGIQQCMRLFNDCSNDIITNIPSQQQQQQQVIIEENKNERDNYRYNPQKMPTSLGICITKEQESKHQIIEFIRSNLLTLMNTMPEMSKLRQEYDKLPAIFQFPKILHLTTLHIDKDKNKLETPHYTQFKESIEVIVNLVGILYLPGKIITGLCQINEMPLGMSMETEFPHLTLMVGETPPRMSTILLSAVFGKGGQYEGGYNDPQGILAGKGTVVDKFKVKIAKKQEDAFIVKGQNGLELIGKTEAWYS